MTICVAAAPVGPVCAIIICDSARPRTSAPYITPMGRPTASCARITDQRGRHMSAERYRRRISRRRNSDIETTTPMACAALVPHAEPFMPMPSSNMKTWFMMALVIVVVITMVIVKRTAEMPLKKPMAAHAMRTEERSAHARGPILQRQLLHVRLQPEGMQQPWTGERQAEEQRDQRQRRPHRVPVRARGTRSAPAAMGLRHEGLHRQAHAAEQEDGAAHDPVDGTHGRHRVGRQPADEPQVREIEQRLHGVRRHERRRQLHDGQSGGRAACPPRRCAVRATCRPREFMTSLPAAVPWSRAGARRRVPGR